MSETATKAQKGKSGVGNLNRWDPSAQQVCLHSFKRVAQLAPLLGGFFAAPF